MIAHLVNANMAPEKGTGWHRHDADFHSIVHNLFDYSPDREHRRVVSPGDFGTVEMPAPCEVPPPSPWH